MGWYFGANSCKEQIAELIKDSDRHKTLAHCLRGTTLWTVGEIQEEPKQRYIGCYLLRNGDQRDGWGYKPLTESMGPCEVSCPLAYLEMVPEPTGEFASAWRKRVRAYHANRAAKLARARQLKIGETIRLTNGHDYQIVQLKPYIKGEDISTGYRYRIPRLMVTLPDATVATVEPDSPKPTLP
jgi:hypothetical protein